MNVARVHGLLLAAAGIAFLSGAPGPARGQAAGLDAPLPVGPFLDGVFPPRTPLAPGSSPWEVVDAFPNLPIENVLAIVPNPSDDRLYATLRDGAIVSFENDEAVASSEPFLDIRDRVAVVWEGGLLNLVFHPEFGTPGSPHGRSFYVYYTSHCPLNAARDAVNLGACNANYPREFTAGYFSVWLRLSRFQASFDAAAGVWRGDPASEQPMFSIRLYNYGHRGGGLTFGADGRLYLSIGDQVGYETAQDIVNRFDGKSLRLEVDVTELGNGSWTCPSGSHLPRRRFQDVSPNPDEMSGRLYCIPDDNPWLSPGGSNYEEYFTIGHRNPFRLSFDPVTGLLWSGDVGDFTREEINVIQRGGNYGWPFREGLTTGPRLPPAVILGTLTDPVVDFDRSEAGALIGGYVYRGARFPELSGRFIAGDYVTRNIWAISLDPESMTASKELLTTFDPGELVTFGQDRSGEIYMGSIAPGVPLQRLERIGDPVPDPPARLSQLGAFTNLATLAPHDAAVPYDLVPFWSDGASKRRWIFLPNDGSHDQPDEQIAFSETGNWSFPVGTVLMKHFELPLDENAPGLTARLETRFLVHGDDGKWYGLTYRWRDDGSDADLLTGAATRALQVRRADGGTETQTWSFPARSQCLTCHTAGAGFALGPRTHQLNRALTYPRTGRTDNQLHTWSALGMLNPPVAAAQIPTLLSGARLDDPTASLEHRARSWLDANCSHCHRPETGNRAAFDARLTTPLSLQGLIWGDVMNDLGIPGARLIHPGNPFASIVFQRVAAVGTLGMPPLVKSRADEQALGLLYEWIRRIDPAFPRQGVAYQYFELPNLSVLPDFDTLTPLRTGTASGFDISVRLRNDDFAFRFTGVIAVPASGAWTFYTRSDDGSRLYVDGQLVVDNDGLHGIQERSGTVQLAAGFHDVVVTMFERGGGEVLAVDWQGPGLPKQAVTADRLFVEPPTGSSNAPPTLANPGVQLALAGHAALLSLSATDPDGDLLYYSASGLPGGLSLDAETGEISGTVAASATGVHTVTASASDGAEVSVVSFPWTVNANHAPTLTSPGNRVSAEGEVISLPLAASDADGDALEFAAEGLPRALSIDPGTGAITGTLLVGSFGSHGVVVSVSDGVDTTEVSFTWQVRARAPGIAYQYFEVSDLQVLPDFDTLTPLRAGSTSNFDTSLSQRPENFAFRFTGVVDVPASGVWTFATRSDDGSRLFIDGAPVVDNDGRHATRKRSGQVSLSAGSHDIVVTMFQWVGGATLEVLWQGPGVPEQPIPSARLYSWLAFPPWRAQWACGIGPELALLLPALLWLRRRPRSVAQARGRCRTPAGADPRPDMPPSAGAR